MNRRKNIANLFLKKIYLLFLKIITVNKIIATREIKKKLANK